MWLYCLIISSIFLCSFLHKDNSYDLTILLTFSFFAFVHINSVLIICLLHQYYTIGKGIFQMNYLKNLLLPNNTLSVYANSSLIILIAIATTIKTAESINTIASPLHRTMPIHPIIPLWKKVPSSIMISPHKAPNFNTSQVLVP